MAESVIQQIRKTETERTTVTPLEGELLYTTDEKKLYVGDGSTAGGILVTGAPFITEDMTLNVPADYSDINEALDYLANFRISNKAIVTIQVANGTYSYTETINLTHPDGQQIVINGNDTDATAVTLNFSSVDKAVSISNGQIIRVFQGFTISGGNNVANGIYISSGGQFQSYTELIVSNFTGSGVIVTNDSRGNFSILKSTYNGDSGAKVTMGSFMTVTSKVIVNNNTNYGIYVNMGTVNLHENTSSQASSNGTNGLRAINSSAVFSRGISASNTNYDFYASGNSYIDRANSNSTNSSPTIGTVGNANSYIQ